MKTTATSRSLLWGSFFGLAWLALVPAAAADKACEDKCHADWPRSIVHAVPRNACLAKCWAIDKAKAAAALGGKVVDKVKEVGGKIIEGVKKIAHGLWDKAKQCFADGDRKSVV